MTYEEFLKFVPSRCMYEAIYDDSDGRTILVIRMLDAYGMVNKAQRQWVDLTPQDLNEIFKVANTGEGAVRLALDKAKEKNT